MGVPSAFDRFVSAITAISLLGIAIVFAWRELGGSSEGSLADGPPTAEEEWQRSVDVGVRIAESTAGVDVIVFSDLQCPFCKRFHEEVWGPLASMFGEEVGLIFVHYPLPMHPQAASAAVAAECAGEQGRFSQFVDTAFLNQHLMAAENWAGFAEGAGVADLERFAACVSDPAPELRGRIDSGLDLGRTISVTGTPTVMVNQWRFGSPPSPDQLVAVVEDVLAGELPTGGT